MSTLTTLESAGDWTNEANLTGADDGSCGHSLSGGDTTGPYSMSFSTVSGTINGLTVVVHAHGQEADDLEIELLDSTSTWRQKITAVYGSNNVDCNNCQDATVGGAADVWGGTWTAAWINSNSFRFRCRFEASPGGSWIAVDNAEITVEFTPAAGGANELVVDDGANELIVDDGTIQKIVD
jgi:hypothetical protein